MSIIIAYELDECPKTCRACPFFIQKPYQCHNETGMDADCKLGFMKGSDMRGFRGNTRFSACDIEHTKHVRISKGERV